MKRKDILSVFHYIPLHSSPAGQRFAKVSGDMRITDDLSGRLLRLPLFFEITDEEVDRVVETVKGFYSGRSAS